VRPRTLGRLAALAALALTACAAQVVATAPPAQAAGCQAETSLVGCDDVTPPDTTLVAVRPAPTPGGFVRQATVSFDFAGVPVDATDTGQIAFECQLYSAASPPAAWQACVSGQAYSGLGDTSTTPYTFRVRAVDATDAAVVCPLIPLCTDEPDHDPTPATATLKVDTLAPNTFITRTPHDDITPDSPVISDRSVQVVLDSNEGGAGFACTLDKSPRPCAGGTLSLTDLSSGSQKLSVAAVDAAGNTDPTPATTTFFVPANIKASRGSGWKRVRKAGAFDGDLVRATRVGATLRIGGLRNVREVRLIAPAGPRLGRIAVRVGRSQWYPVDLAGKSTRHKTYVVRNHFTPVQSGAIQIRVLSLPPGGAVRLDALVARR
jgi:hypothetical protein